MAKILSMVAVAMLLVASAAAQIRINSTTKDGETIAGEYTFRVTVEAKDLVTQVEFYVGDDLRDSDASTPYEFKVDTLTLPDGPLEVTFAAYTSEGDSIKKSLKVTVDNGLSKGADFHVDQAKGFLTLGEWDKAIQAGRVALKIKPGYVPARVIMARANLGKGVFDAAQKFAEDAALAEPENLEVLDLMSAIALKRAFNTFNRGSTDKKETLTIIKEALKTAIESRRKIVEARLEAVGSPTDANRLAYVDAALAAGRYNLAIAELKPMFTKDNRDNKVADRLLYAYLRSNKYADAVQTYTTHKKYGVPDAYGIALYAIVLDQMGKDTEASDQEREAILSDGENLGVRTMQAYLALRRNRTDVLSKLAQAMVADEGQRPEVGYYLTASYYRLGDFQNAKDWFERTALAEPTLYDLFVERANQSIALVVSGRVTGDSEQKTKEEIAFQLDLALAFLDAALAAKPDSAVTLTGIALTNLIAGNTGEGVKFARAAAAANPQYAAGQYTLAAALDLYSKALVRTRTTDNARQVDAEVSKLNTEALKASEAAAKLDAANLEGRGTPSAVTAWQYYYRFGRAPLLTLP